MTRRLMIAALVAAVSTTASAAETKRWVLDSAAELLKGAGEGVAVTHDGRLEPVAGWGQRVPLDEPVANAVVQTGDRELIVGTGFPARLYRVDPSGKELLTEFKEEQVTALLKQGKNELIATTVAPASLYRVRKGEAELVSQLGQGGMWDMASFEGRVVVAAGPPATLFRLTNEGLQRWLELPDAHARCLLATPDTLFVGTSGKGLIFAVQWDGRVSLVTDSPFTEISSMAMGEDGTLWATALVGEPPSQTPAKAGSGEVSVETSAATQDLELPKVNGATASSELIRLTPEGAIIRVHRFKGQVASALAADGEGVLVGTGFEGEIWRFIGDGGARLASIDAVQATEFADGVEAVLVQGPAGVLWEDSEPSVNVRFRSPSLRLKRPARFGNYRVIGSTAGARIRFRSGASAKPDESWLPWSDWMPSEGAVPIPPARSLQWELGLVSPESEVAVVDRVEISYREVNLRPRIESVELEEPGVIYLSSPPSSGPVIDVSNPDFNGIFSVVEPNGKGGSLKPRQGKKYWRVGYRTVVWKAEDANEDSLKFDIAIESVEGIRLPVRERLTTTQLGVDTTALPDGRYRFLISASDEPENPAKPLQDSMFSSWFTVDNQPPTVEVTRDGDDWEVEIADELSALVRVEMSRDGKGWKALEPADRILDGSREKFVFPAAEGEHLVVVRAIDRHHNRTTRGIMEKP